MPHKRKKTLHLAWFASVGHSYTNIQNKYDHRITPELGIKWEWYNLSVGYNIPTSAYRDNCTNLFRATFSLNLFQFHLQTRKLCLTKWRLQPLTASKRKRRDEEGLWLNKCLLAFSFADTFLFCLRLKNSYLRLKHFASRKQFGFKCRLCLLAIRYLQPADRKIKF